MKAAQEYRVPDISTPDAKSPIVSLSVVNDCRVLCAAKSTHGGCSKWLEAWLAPIVVPSQPSVPTGWWSNYGS
jgi:hypothetical protein